MRAWPIRLDPNPQKFYVEVYTNDQHTHDLTFSNFPQAKVFAESLNKHSLSRKSKGPYEIPA